MSYAVKPPTFLSLTLSSADTKRQTAKMNREGGLDNRNAETGLHTRGVRRLRLHLKMSRDFQKHTHTHTIRNQRLLDKPKRFCRPQFPAQYRDAAWSSSSQRCGPPKCLQSGKTSVTLLDSAKLLMLHRKKSLTAAGVGWGKRARWGTLPWGSEPRKDWTARQCSQYAK